MHVVPGNYIIKGWSADDWFNNSEYHHIVHIHGDNDFDFGNESTSNIESVWEDLKRILSRLYDSVKSDNFKWRKTAHLNNNQKWMKLIMFLFNYKAQTWEFNLYDKNEFIWLL